jgi:hypothetical protein
MSIVQLEPFTCASCSFASTSYHAKRLEESHLIAQVGLEAAEDTLTPYYMSLIDDNRPVLRVLQATEASDNSS